MVNPQTRRSSVIIILLSESIDRCSPRRRLSPRESARWVWHAAVPNHVCSSVRPLFAFIRQERYSILNRCLMLGRTSKPRLDAAAPGAGAAYAVGREERITGWGFAGAGI